MTTRKIGTAIAVMLVLSLVPVAAGSVLRATDSTASGDTTAVNNAGVTKDLSFDFQYFEGFPVGSSFIPSETNIAAVPVGFITVPASGELADDHALNQSAEPTANVTATIEQNGVFVSPRDAPCSYVGGPGSNHWECAIVTNSLSPAWEMTITVTGVLDGQTSPTDTTPKTWSYSVEKVYNYPDCGDPAPGGGWC